MVKKAGQADSDLDEEIGRDGSVVDEETGLVSLANHAREISTLSESVASGLWEIDHDRAEACEKSSRVKVGPLQVSARE